MQLSGASLALLLAFGAAACASATKPPAAASPPTEGLTPAQCVQVFGEPHPPASLVDLAGWSARRGIATDCGRDDVVGPDGNGECTAGPVAIDGETVELAIRVRDLEGLPYVVNVAAKPAR